MHARGARRTDMPTAVSAHATPAQHRAVAEHQRQMVAAKPGFSRRTRHRWRIVIGQWPVVWVYCSGALWPVVHCMVVGCLSSAAVVETHSLVGQVPPRPAAGRDGGAPGARHVHRLCACRPQGVRADCQWAGSTVISPTRSLQQGCAGMCRAQQRVSSAYSAEYALK